MHLSNHVSEIVKYYSEYFECAVGLRQSEVISPIIFAMFINDLELFLSNDAK